MKFFVNAVLNDPYTYIHRPLTLCFAEKLGLVVTVFPKIGHPLEDFPRPSQLIALERSDYVNQSQEAYQIEAYAHANFVSIKGI